MHCIIMFCLWKAEWWDTQASRRVGSLSSSASDPPAVSSSSPPISEELQNGLRAYAAEHADLERSMADHLQKKWEGVRAKAIRAIAGLDRGEDDTDEAGADDDINLETVVEINLDFDDDFDDFDDDFDNSGVDE